MNKEIESIKKYIRAADYISAAQIFLDGNYLLEQDLEHADIKSRLLGHWGTCPGINFTYAHLQRLIKKTGSPFLFVLGPGHGFPALQANLFLEGTLSKYYKEATHTKEGLSYIIKNFSWPYGFPSHSSPSTPGVIVEGGELGYSLSTSYGAVLDNKDLIVACLVGDGEAETGPTATAWHLSKFIDPKENGAVLPILHLNGYKISAPTIFGRMSNKELTSLFYGYGYNPIIVEGNDKNIHQKMIRALEQSYKEIRLIQEKSRVNKKALTAFWRFPMIVLKTPKGWGGPKERKNEKIEGNHLSHQVVATEAKTDAGDLKIVSEWLSSYKFNELFDTEKGFAKEIMDLLPEDDLKMGDNPIALGLQKGGELIVPDYTEFVEDASVPGTIGSSSMRRIGLYLKKVFEVNKEKKNFRLMSPDETYSNKLDAVFETTARAYAGPKLPFDKDLEPEGRVMEMLSEHSLQGLLQGYVLTGRHGVFASYEAFVQVVSSMADQYAKFLKIAIETPWRHDIPSFNYILTSSGWRQEHNGFSHQNPGFIDNMLQKQGCFVRVFFPPDANSALAVMRKCLLTKNVINVIVAGKTVEPRWLTPELAEKELDQGLAIWDFASDEDPDIVFSAAGEYLTKETLAAIDILKTESPKIKVRFVSIMELSGVGIGSSDCKIPTNDFESYFTSDKPVIFNFHGYPETLKQSLFDQVNERDRIFVHGYVENGSTTTPLDLHLRNKTSRYDLVIEALQELGKRQVLSGEESESLVKKYKDKIRDHREYIIKNGVDPEEIESWQWKR
jgi:xylulose-5-phosphate/fructose-6-phosphate phosphoketolase